MSRQKVTVGSLVTVCSLLSAIAALSQVPNAALNLGPVQPAPGWGNTCTYNVYASQNGRPVKNANIEFFFSGKHSLESAHWTKKTGSDGRATFSVAIPRSWQSSGTWVNANAICSNLGIQRNWRVKQ